MTPVACPEKNVLLTCDSVSELLLGLSNTPEPLSRLEIT